MPVNFPKKNTLLIIRHLSPVKSRYVFVARTLVRQTRKRHIFGYVCQTGYFAGELYPVSVIVILKLCDVKQVIKFVLFLVSRRSLDMMRVRATDPRPCPKCGKIYRSAHTLRTHLEDKHTICPGYRCVLCGTVAKSRNSLHSHMSRQHRGISTKDLPVLPMPAPFDPDLASR